MTEHSHLRLASGDRGFTLVEILIVIVILGVVAVATVFAVRGITDRGETASCRTDRDVLTSAAEYYMVEDDVESIVPSGTGADRFEQTLVDDDFLEAASSLHDLRVDGSVVSPGDPCP